MGTSLSDLRNTISKIPVQIEIVEIRFDSLQEYSCKDIESFLSSISRHTIGTCRSKKMGGVYPGSESDRIQLLRFLAGKCTYVDVEIETIERLSEPFDRKNSHLIVSYHNFECTPNYWALMKIIARIKEFTPDIIKIATMVQSSYEVTKLYRLMVNKMHDEQRIIIGMGELGRITRLIGLYLGNELTFVSHVCGSSAPGQISYEQLLEMSDVIQKNCLMKS